MRMLVEDAQQRSRHFWPKVRLLNRSPYMIETLAGFDASHSRRTFRQRGCGEAFRDWGSYRKISVGVGIHASWTPLELHLELV
jgi:hypothetical protein